MGKKTIFSGIQPTGTLTIGNYLGALKNWAALQDEYFCCFAVVDLHAITVKQDPRELKERCMRFITLYLAAGIDPKKSLIFFQSHVHTHAQLAWVLNCFAYMGELSRMTQFKEKSARHNTNINVGLFDYPVLMAADILAYQTDLVPVGSDQKQHLELARDLAMRFNGIYGPVFKVPEPFIPPVGARIMSLVDPKSKMSKTDENPGGYISVLDSPAEITKKLRRAVTDSEAVIAFREGKDGVNNLLAIYGAIKGMAPEAAAAEFSGKGYGDLKNAVAEAVIEELAPLREKYDYLLKNKDYIEEIYTSGAQKALEITEKTVQKVHKKLGFVSG